MLVTHRQCMTPVAAGNTNPVTLISYSFVGVTQTVKCKVISIQLLSFPIHVTGSRKPGAPLMGHGGEHFRQYSQCVASRLVAITQ